MLKQILYLFSITMLPAVELRGSIPYGILALKMSWLEVFIICTLANILIAPIFWLFLHYLLFLFQKINVINNLYQRWEASSQRKLEPYIKKYGILGLAIFIGVPLPGTGVYTGVLGAYLLGFKFKDALITSILGAIMAGIIVTAVIVSGSEIFSLFVGKI